MTPARSPGAAVSLPGSTYQESGYAGPSDTAEKRVDESNVKALFESIEREQPFTASVGGTSRGTMRA